MDNTDDEQGMDCDASTCSSGSDEEESTLSLPLSNALLLPLQSGQESSSRTSGMLFDDDGYIWRKYVEEQIMGIPNSYYSYYRCALPNCKVRKRTRHSGNGHITDCSYRGVHNHAIPKLNSTVSVDSVPSAVEQTPHNFGQWCDLIRIELMDSKVCELPESPDFPKLKELLLQKNADLMEIPHSFFNHMPLLQHLDLSYTSIRDLPPSVSKLTQLKTFYLRGCDLFLELPPQIGQLKNLQEFDLEGTLIIHLPKEIGELINLQSLTLCFDRCYHLLGHDKRISNSTIIPPGVISNLAQLNYLSIDVDPEDERWNENVTNVLMEIFGLGRLMRVSIYVPNADFLKVIPIERSSILRLIVGHHRRRFISRVTPEVEEIFKSFWSSMKFVNGVNVPFPFEVKMILTHLEAFYLDRHMTIKSLSVSGLKYLYRLRACILAECNKMETIVNESSDLHDRPALPNLELLSVFYMKNLRSIYQGSTPSFWRLKSIALHTCPMLTTVFTLNSLINLIFLEEIIIEDCPKVTTLIRHDSVQQTPKFLFFFTELKRMSLLYLPELVNIFNGLPVVHNALEELAINYCPKLQSLSKWELSSRSLEMIKGERMWWDALKWDPADWGHLVPPSFLETKFFPINETEVTQLACQTTPVSMPYKDHTDKLLKLDADELDDLEELDNNMEAHFEKRARLGEVEEERAKRKETVTPVCGSSNQMSASN